MWHYILLTFESQHLSALFYYYQFAWSESISRFKMAAIVRFDLYVSEKEPFSDKIVTEKCISANDMQIQQ